jgi:class 3 adenylate cyclase
MPETRAQQRLAALDRPLIGLALLAVALYLAQLFRLVPASLHKPCLVANFAIDFIFLVDLIAKCKVLGRPYLRSPWFVIDLLSTAPIVGSTLELFTLFAEHFRLVSAVRMARVARLGRVARLASIARVARVVRALRAAQGLRFLDLSAATQTPTFDSALRLAVPSVLAAFVALAYYIDHRVQNAETSDFIQGLLVLFVVLVVLAMAHVGRSLARDRQRGAEAAILQQCFSPPIVDTFYSSPEILDHYHQPWMSVFFLDVRGFTAATQKHANDLETLALRLRRVMDIARREIVVTFEGVIDKFMGDAVMGWIGGPFSKRWELIAPLRRELLFDALERAADDVNTLARELAAARDGTGEVQGALDEARAQLRELEERHRKLLDGSPELRARYQQAFDTYRREVARAAVQCVLAISDQVAAQADSESFRELKIGLASGPACVGNFGSSQQVGFTILGPTVNRAARLEPASHQCGCRVLVDHDTYLLIGDDAELLFRRWGKVEVKGIEGGLPVYEPMRASDETRGWLGLFHRARERVEAGALEEAVTLFERADQARPGGDPASQRWTATVRSALAAGQREVSVFHASKG